MTQIAVSLMFLIGVITLWGVLIMTNPGESLLHSVMRATLVIVLFTTLAVILLCNAYIGGV